MTEPELYKELGILTKDKDRWNEAIPYVSSLLSHDSVKIQAKALWLLGEIKVWKLRMSRGYEIFVSLRILKRIGWCEVHRCDIDRSVQ